MRISDWSSDVCSSDLRRRPALALSHPRRLARALGRGADDVQIAVGLASVDAARIENARAWRAAEYRRDVHPTRPARLAPRIGNGLCPSGRDLCGLRSAALRGRTESARKWRSMGVPDDK